MSEKMEIQMAGEQEEKSALAQITGAEVDLQVSTAKRYPRSVTKAYKDAVTMATVSREMAASCIYALPRGGKSITGPSVRLAEIMATTWGNLRCEGRVIEEGQKHVTAQATVWDMQSNVLVRTEVRRRITGKNGQRYSDDMINTTANAAVSIALRNAMFRVVPRSVVDQVYAKAKDAAVGSIKTIAERRGDALTVLAAFGITQDRVLSRLDRHGVEDITLEDIELLIGLHNAIRDEEVTPDEAFPEVRDEEDKPAEPKTSKDAAKAILTGNGTESGKAPEPEPEGLTLGGVFQIADKDFVPTLKVKEWMVDVGVVEDDKRTHTAKRMEELVLRIKDFVNQAG